MGDSSRDDFGIRQSGSEALGDKIGAQVIVVLSAYNGSRHIAEQIESIRAQSLTEWKLIVRDDGSTDNTIEIVKSFAARDPRISLVSDALGNIGPWASFAELLKIARDSRADYVFVSDQDDVWLPDKIETQLPLLERRREQPALVHSDLKVVDENLKEIHSSFKEFQRASYDANDPLRTLLIHNAVVGCTIGVNRALLDFGLPIPDGVWHDWWLALCAALTGSIESTRAPSVLYRQHAHNVVGGAEPPRRSFLSSLATHPFAYTRQSLRAFNDGLIHATRLRARMKERGAGGAAAKRVDDYCDAFESPGIVKRLRAYRTSEARPQRMVSRAVMLGIVAAFPAIKALTRDA